MTRRLTNSEERAILAALDRALDELHDIRAELTRPTTTGGEPRAARGDICTRCGRFVSIDRPDHAHGEFDGVDYVCGRCLTADEDSIADDLLDGLGRWQEWERPE